MQVAFYTNRKKDEQVKITGNGSFLFLQTRQMAFNFIFRLYLKILKKKIRNLFLYSKF